MKSALLGRALFLCLPPAILANGALLLGCAMLSTSSGSDGGSSGATSGDGGGAEVSTSSAMGSGCATDPMSGVTLCTGTSLCPAVVVDHDLYPDCGFRIQGTVLDLECACNGAVCPIGIATTCTQAAQLLSQQSEVGVCTQVSESRCTGGGPAGPTSDAGAGGCDQNCFSQCGGDPGCIRLCGC